MLRRLTSYWVSLFIAAIASSTLYLGYCLTQLDHLPDIFPFFTLFLMLATAFYLHNFVPKGLFVRRPERAESRARRVGLRLIWGGAGLFSALIYLAIFVLLLNLAGKRTGMAELWEYRIYVAGFIGAFVVIAAGAGSFFTALRPATGLRPA